jgi:hypothetical protein
MLCSSVFTGRLTGCPESRLICSVWAILGIERSQIRPCRLFQKRFSPFANKLRRCRQLQILIGDSGSQKRWRACSISTQPEPLLFIQRRSSQMRAGAASFERSMPRPIGGWSFTHSLSSSSAEGTYRWPATTRRSWDFWSASRLGVDRFGVEGRFRKKRSSQAFEPASPGDCRSWRVRACTSCSVWRRLPQPRCSGKLPIDRESGEIATGLENPRFFGACRQEPELPGKAAPACFRSRRARRRA